MWDTVVYNDLYVTDNEASNVQAFTLAGVFLGKWATYANGPYGLSNPSGIDVDRVHRPPLRGRRRQQPVQVFSVTTPKPAYESTKPTITMTTPTQGAVLGAAGQYVVRGTAADNAGVAGVFVAIQNSSTGKWWFANEAVWVAAETWNIAGWSGANPTSVAWAFPMNGLAPGTSYLVKAKSLDLSVNYSLAIPQANISVLTEVHDTADPETVVGVPIPNQVFRSNQPVVLSGSATDDVGVAAVRVGVSRPGGSGSRPTGAGRRRSPGSTRWWPPPACRRPRGAWR